MGAPVVFSAPPPPEITSGPKRLADRPEVHHVEGSVHGGCAQVSSVFAAPPPMEPAPAVFSAPPPAELIPAPVSYAAPPPVEPEVHHHIVEHHTITTGGAVYAGAPPTEPMPVVHTGAVYAAPPVEPVQGGTVTMVHPGSIALAQ